jgi:hypothetical protein
MLGLEAEKPGLGLVGCGLVSFGLGLVGFGLEASGGLQPKRNVIESKSITNNSQKSLMPLLVLHLA